MKNNIKVYIFYALFIYNFFGMDNNIDENIMHQSDKQHEMSVLKIEHKEINIDLDKNNTKEISQREKIEKKSIKDDKKENLNKIKKFTSKDFVQTISNIFVKNIEKLTQSINTEDEILSQQSSSKTDDKNIKVFYTGVLEGASTEYKQENIESAHSILNNANLYHSIDFILHEKNPSSFNLSKKEILSVFNNIYVNSNNNELILEERLSGLNTNDGSIVCFDNMIFILLNNHIFYIKDSSIKFSVKKTKKNIIYKAKNLEDFKYCKTKKSISYFNRIMFYMITILFFVNVFDFTLHFTNKCNNNSKNLKSASDITIHRVDYDYILCLTILQQVHALYLLNPNILNNLKVDDKNIVESGFQKYTKGDGDTSRIQNACNVLIENNI